MTLAGLQATIEYSGTGRVTVDRAPTTAERPMETPGTTNASAAIQAFGPTVIGPVINEKSSERWSWVAVQRLSVV